MKAADAGDTRYRRADEFGNFEADITISRISGLQLGSCSCGLSLVPLLSVSLNSAATGDWKLKKRRVSSIRKIAILSAYRLYLIVNFITDQLLI